MTCLDGGCLKLQNFAGNAKFFLNLISKGDVFNASFCNRSFDSTSNILRLETDFIVLDYGFERERREIEGN